MPVAVVTDSTAYLPPDLVRARGLTVVPLTVVLNGAEGLEGVETSPADATRALSGRRVSVSTSRPAPEQFAQVYRTLLGEGADGVVSVHLSAELSGTVEAARLAAAEVGDDRVTVVDSRSTGMGLGFPALAAAAAAARGDDLTGVRDAALDAVARTTIYFYVDTLEFLRLGGRINAARRCSAPPSRSSRSCTCPMARSWSRTRSVPPAGAWHAWSTSPSRRQATPLWTSPCTTSPRRNGPSSC